MSDYRPGDEVEVTLRGTVVQYDTKAHLRLKLSDGLEYYLGAGHAFGEVKVIKRALPKVGDTVTGQESVDLPRGSVIKNSRGGLSFKDDTAIWRWTGPRSPRPAGGDYVYTIEYLPEN